MGLPDEIAELSHAAVASGAGEHERGERFDLRPRVGGDDGKPDRAQAVGVVDVVAHVSRVVERDAELRRALAQDGQLVLDALDVVGPKLPCAGADDRVLLERDDQIADADLVEPSEAEAVAARECERFLSLFVHPHAIVGEHSVKVEDGEPHACEPRVALAHARDRNRRMRARMRLARRGCALRLRRSSSL